MTCQRCRDGAATDKLRLSLGDDIDLDRTGIPMRQPRCRVYRMTCVGVEYDPVRWSYLRGKYEPGSDDLEEMPLYELDLCAECRETFVSAFGHWFRSGQRRAEIQLDVDTPLLGIVIDPGLLR